MKILFPVMIFPSLAGPIDLDDPIAVWNEKLERWEPPEEWRPTTINIEVEALGLMENTNDK